MGGEISHDGDFLVFEGNHYRNGFMYKNFVMSAIVSTCMFSFTCPVHYRLALCLLLPLLLSLSPLLQLHDGVKPTLQELEKFEATPEEVELEGTKNQTHTHTQITCTVGPLC